MEKRLLLAVFLIGAVIMITSWLFPPPPAPEQVAGADSTAVATTPAARAPVVAAAPLAAPAESAVAVAPADTVVVRSPLYEYAFSTRGAALLRASILRYPSYTQPGEPVQLVPAGTRDFLTHRLVIGGDTVDLRGAAFQASAPGLALDSASGSQSLRFLYSHPSGFGVELTYTFHPGTYAIDVAGRVAGVRGAATLLTEIGPGLSPHEAFDHHSERELALVTRTLDDADRERLSSLEGVYPVEGPLTWAGIKDKYFLAAVVAPDSGRLGGAVAREVRSVRQPFVDGGDTTFVTLPRARVTTEVPLAADGSFAYRAYVGPQEYEILAALGHEFEDVTPYGYRWLQPIIRPFAAFILWIVNGLHTSLGLAYGWVLVLFGVLMRVVLWPLNSKAMRAQLKNAHVAPLMQEIRTKYADNPEKQQQELVRLYKEEGFNPMAGCLPLLIPMPVLITLFFVFQNTIAFRGAEFLWLPDLSLRDPWYILPVFLVASMFALQWISTKLSGMEQNPQMKMMMYVMPLMIGVLFFTLPSGLNLYYAATNVASLPQQLLIARERRRHTEAQKAKTAKPEPVPVPGARGKRKK